MVFGDAGFAFFPRSLELRLALQSGLSTGTGQSSVLFAQEPYTRQIVIRVIQEVLRLGEIIGRRGKLCDLVHLSS